MKNQQRRCEAFEARTGSAAASQNDHGSGSVPLSGAYMRTLVKQLTSSKKTHEPEDKQVSGMNLSSKNALNSGYESSCDTKNGENQCASSRTKKKQVRRRFYQPTPLLNTVEMRREVMMALKKHRAAMHPAAASSSSSAAPAVSSSSSFSSPSFADNFTDSTQQQMSYSSSLAEKQHVFINPCDLMIDEFLPSLHAETATTISTTSPSSASSSSSSFAQTQKIMGSNSDSNVAKKWHVAVSDEELAEMVLIAERNEIEWHDMLSNMDYYAWCLTLLDKDDDDNPF